MPRAELKIRMRPLAKRGAELVLEILLTPRGSGNRELARQMARAARNHPKLGPHVRRVQAGSSKVMVHLIPSVELMRVVAQWQRDEVEAADVPGQLPLFGGPVAAG
jgi:hypothetical protein